MHIQNLMKFCPFVLKILSENKILTSIKGHSSVINKQKLTDCNNIPTWILFKQEILPPIKGHNSVTNKQKLTGNYPDLVNINAYTKYDEILSICSKVIE